MSAVLISATELAERLEDVTLLDVRWKLGGPPGHGEYLKGHIPGAVYVALDTELAAHGAPTDGRHPLPSLEALIAAPSGLFDNQQGTFWIKLPPGKHTVAISPSGSP